MNIPWNAQGIVIPRPRPRNRLHSAAIRYFGHLHLAGPLARHHACGHCRVRYPRTHPCSKQRKTAAKCHWIFCIKAHAHMLRHACGFALANAGHDTRAIQAYLGHRNIQNTTRYTALAPQRFKEFFRD
jgi:integrase